MAIIKCPKCQNEISDKAKECLYCGAELIQDFHTAKICDECHNLVPDNARMCMFCGCPVKKENKLKAIIKLLIQKVKQRRGRLFICITAIVLISLVFLPNMILSDDEKLAYQNVLHLQDMMKDPDSFKLYDSIFLLKKYDDEGELEYTYTIIEYGGTNGYGAMLSGEAIFKDYTYIADFSDEPDTSDLERAAVLLELHLLTYTGDMSSYEKIDIDVEKIKNKVGLKD